MDYIERICDSELQDKLDAFGAVHVIGPKWCGKQQLLRKLQNHFFKCPGLESA